MSARRLTLLAAAALAMLAPSVQAQTAEDYMRMFDPLNQQMAGVSNQIIGQHYNNPAVQQAYMQARGQGYPGSYEQFILDQVEACWGQCVQQAQANARSRADAERMALLGLRGAQQNFGNAIQGRNDSAANNLLAAGGNNVGVWGVTNPETGQTDLRPYIDAGEPFASSNPNWRTDPQGRPCLLNPATGWCQYPPQ